MSLEAMIQEAKESMVNCDRDAALAAANNAVAENVDLMAVLSDGFSAGIREVGDLFSKGKVFLPELMLTAECMQDVTKVIENAMAKNGGVSEKKGVMVIATVQGDVHDIGKGIVISLVKTQGVEVIDLGRDISVEDIIAAAEAYNANIIGTSALLTTTLNQQKELEDALEAKGLRAKYKTMVGGAPATQRWADRIGANAYAEDAAEAVVKVLQLLN